MNPSETLRTLRSVLPALEGLSEPLTRVLEEESQHIHAPAGTTLFDTGSPCPRFLVVVQGVVRVVRVADDGREILLYRVYHGEACALTVSCLLGATNYPARGVVEEAVDGVSFPKELFERLLAEVPAFRESVFRLVGDRIADLTAAFQEVAFLRLDQRLAGVLLRVRASTGRNDLSVTHQRLADDLGSSREVVSRVLESMRDEGLVQLERGRVTILDAEGMALRVSRR